MATKKKPTSVQPVEFQLPVKPDRKAKAPGVEVDLVTNLFRISLKTEKPIFCYTITVDLISPDPKPKDGDSAKQPALPRKIPKEMRQEAVKNAVEKWIKNNNATKLDNSFVLDSNASTMYALFQMLPNHDGTSTKRQSLEFTSSAKSNSIVDQKLKLTQEEMLVKIFSPSPVDVRALVDHCAGRRPRSSVEMEATIKSLNTILTGKIVTVPGYIGTQAKAGSYSVFKFDRPHQFQVSKGVICNKGFITSVRPSETGLVTNLANTVIPLYEPMLLTDFVVQRYRYNDFSKGLPDKLIDELKRELRTKQVEATHINYGTKDRPHYRKYRIHGFGSSTIKEKFDLRVDGSDKTIQISVFDYFKKEYPKSPLKYPNLPCVIDNTRKIPMEVCRLVDKQKVNRKMTPDETSEVIKKMAVRPEEYFKTVEQNRDELLQHCQPFKDFGLEINQKLIELKGRELPPIKLLACNKQPLSTSDGAYNNQRVKFVKAATVNKWALVILIDGSIKRQVRSQAEFVQECTKFAGDYVQSGRLKGVNVSPISQESILFVDLDSCKIEREMKAKLREKFQFLNSKNYDHAIFVLPDYPDWVYSYLQYLEVDVPRQAKMSTRCTRTSCIKSKNFMMKILRGDQRSSSMFISNLWLKYNTKLGGTNIALDASQNFSIDAKEFTNFLSPDYLYVSIDVCHPAPGDRLEQSVAAVVGMWNLTNPNMSWCTRVRVQRKDKSDKEKSTVEQVMEIGTMFEEIIESFKQRSAGKVPAKIVILRDGVSEGQFKMVLQYELSQVKAKISNFYNKIGVKPPLLACFTVQKRHRVRFMRKKPVQARRGPDFNTQPGTVVDNTIVEPQHFSFYSQPHKAIQGTARAPHVHVIYDEIKFSQDSAQAMIFALSYLSPRCTKGTSIPTPVNLADLAAERGKNIVVSWNEDKRDKKFSQADHLIQLNAFLSTMGDPDYKNTMYYV